MSVDNSTFIVVTGFGPFGPHLVNDSWECVKKLKKMKLEEELNIILITREIPVLYTASDKEVPRLWTEYNPALVIHVGVHNTDDIVVESGARKAGYSKPDVSGSWPSTNCCPSGNEECIRTGIDLDEVIRSVDTKGIKLSVSKDAGNYLCEYTYYLSLCQDPEKTLFIHIPPASSKTSFEDKTAVLKNIIISVYTYLTCNKIY